MIVIAGHRSASSIVGPVMLALALTILFHPLRARLERRLPLWAASMVVRVAAYVHDTRSDLGVSAVFGLRAGLMLWVIVLHCVVNVVIGR